MAPGKWLCPLCMTVPLYGRHCQQYRWTRTGTVAPRPRRKRNRTIRPLPLDVSRKRKTRCSPTVRQCSFRYAGQYSHRHMLLRTVPAFIAGNVDGKLKHGQAHPNAETLPSANLCVNALLQTCDVRSITSATATAESKVVRLSC